MTGNWLTLLTAALWSGFGLCAVLRAVASLFQSDTLFEMSIHGLFLSLGLGSVVIGVKALWALPPFF